MSLDFGAWRTLSTFEQRSFIHRSWFSTEKFISSLFGWIIQFLGNVFFRRKLKKDAKNKTIVSKHTLIQYLPFTPSNSPKTQCFPDTFCCKCAKVVRYSVRMGILFDYCTPTTSTCLYVLLFVCLFDWNPSKRAKSSAANLKAMVFGYSVKNEPLYFLD